MLFVDISSSANCVNFNTRRIKIDCKNNSNLTNPKPIKPFPLPFHLFNIEVSKWNNALLFNSDEKLAKLTLNFGSIFEGCLL